MKPDERPLRYVRGAFPCHAQGEVPFGPQTVCQATWSSDMDGRLVAACPHYRYRHEHQRVLWAEAPDVDESQSLAERCFESVLRAPPLWIRLRQGSEEAEDETEC